MKQDAVAVAQKNTQLAANNDHSSRLDIKQNKRGSGWANQLPMFEESDVHTEMLLEEKMREISQAGSLSCFSSTYSQTCTPVKSSVADEEKVKTSFSGQIQRYGQ